jgi:2-dehydro-3-deoxygluconokinase
VDLVTLGETLVCLTGQETGRREAGPPLRKSIRGGASNTPLRLCPPGLGASGVSCGSRDGFGDEILKVLRGEGVDVSGVVRAAEPTGLMVKERRAPGDVHIHYYRKGSAASYLEADHLDTEMIAEARRLHVTGVTLAIGPRTYILQQHAEIRLIAAPDLLAVYNDLNRLGEVHQVGTKPDGCMICCRTCDESV